MGGRGGAWLCAAAVLVAGLAPVARAAPPAPAPAPAASETSVAVTSCPASGVRVPADYLGLSIEWSMVQHWFGTSRETAVPATVRLLRSLTPRAGTGGILRIGGSSQDGYRWDADGTLEGNRLFFGTVTPGLIDALLAVAEQSGWKLVLGLNLRADQPAEAAAMTRYAAAQDRNRVLLAVAPGNEPHEYLPDDDAYLERFGRYVAALDADALTRAVPLTGPDVSNGADLGRIETLRRAHGSRLAFTGWHDYGNRPTIATLLSEPVQQRYLSRLATARQASASLPVRMSEGNSVGRGGLKRVSDVSGSAAWTLDSMVGGAQGGLAGYTLHAWDNHYYMQPGWNARYTPFFVREGKAFPAPGVYALALASELAGRRFCATRTGVPVGGTVKAWSLTGDLEPDLVVLLANKGTEPQHASRVTLTLPEDATGDVTLSRVADPEGCGGRTTALNGAVLQRDGVLSWTPEPLTRADNDTVSVTLAPCQVAVVRAASDAATGLVRLRQP